MKILLIVFCVVSVMSVKIESGELQILVKSPAVPGSDKFKVNVNSQLKSQLKLTQSSTIEVKADITFSEASFEPQLFTLRLIHPQYKKLTEPVLVTKVDDVFQAIVDLGDPKTIQPYSDSYQLQLIISDDRLQSSIKKIIANTKITFRQSMDQVPEEYLQYNVQSIIRSDPPQERVDPPQIFTAFVLVLDVVMTIIFFYGLSYLGVNVKLLMESGSGLVLNVILIGLLLVNMLFLFKFWMEWTFLNTIQNMFWLMIPTALVANYAFLNLKK